MSMRHFPNTKRPMLVRNHLGHFYRFYIYSVQEYRVSSREWNEQCQKSIDGSPLSWNQALLDEFYWVRCFITFTVSYPKKPCTENLQRIICDSEFFFIQFAQSNKCFFRILWGLTYSASLFNTYPVVFERWRHCSMLLFGKNVGSLFELFQTLSAPALLQSEAQHYSELWGAM